MKNHAHLLQFYIRFIPVVSSEIIYWKIRFPQNFKFSPTLPLGVGRLLQKVAHSAQEPSNGHGHQVGYFYGVADGEQVPPALLGWYFLS